MESDKKKSSVAMGLQVFSPSVSKRSHSHPMWVDFGSDVSAVKDLNKALDDQMAEREAQRDKERRALVDLQTSHLRRTEETAWLLMKRMTTGSTESVDSGVSFKSDRSKAGQINFKDRVSVMSDFSSSEEEDVADDEGLVKSPDSHMTTGRPESPDSSVSFKSDQSKGQPIDFKDRVSPRLDFSSSEEEDDVSDEGFFESPDNLRSDFSCFEEDVVSDDKDWTTSSDDLEEMNQELSSEVGWKHG